MKLDLHRIWRVAVGDMSREEIGKMKYMLNWQEEIPNWETWNEVVTALDFDNEVAAEVFTKATLHFLESERELINIKRDLRNWPDYSLGTTHQEKNGESMVSLIVHGPNNQEISVNFSFTSKGVFVDIRLDGELVSELMGHGDKSRWEEKADVGYGGPPGATYRSRYLSEATQMQPKTASSGDLSNLGLIEDDS